MRMRLVVIPIMLICAASAVATGRAGQEELRYTADFGIEPHHEFVPDGGNRYFFLKPGRFVRLEGVEEGEFIEVEHTVLEAIRPVAFEVDGAWSVAITRVVEEREWVDGVLAEVSLLFVAHCPQSGSVFCFGEHVDVYENGNVVGHEGSWLAGTDGAEPGLLMPGTFLLGARYFQGLAPGVSMDRAELVKMGLEVKTPAGLFDNSVMVLETSELEPEEETLKVYAPKVGLILDGPLELVEYRD